MTPQHALQECIDSMLKVARVAEALKRECGSDPESAQAIRNSEYMNISYAARAAITQAKQALAEPQAQGDGELDSLTDAVMALVELLGNHPAEVKNIDPLAWAHLLVYTHQASEPAGWKLVPVEPTPEMCHTAEAEIDADSSWPAIWAAMLAAAPEAK
jgi:hypothetical protein